MTFIPEHLSTCPAKAGGECSCSGRYDGSQAEGIKSAITDMQSEPSQDDKHSKLLELIAQWEAEANFFGNASDSQADRYAAQAFKRCADELRRIL